MFADATMFIYDYLRHQFIMRPQPPVIQLSLRHRTPTWLGLQPYSPFLQPHTHSQFLGHRSFPKRKVFAMTTVTTVVSVFIGI